MTRRNALPALLLALGACAATPHPASGHAGPPTGASIEPSGFATVLHAPPSPSSSPLPRLPSVEAELPTNPDQAASTDARALHRTLKAQAAGNYIGMRIVRDPDPRHAFQFRRDAAATLARFTSDPRFVATQGGVPQEELQPLCDEWWQRFRPHRILDGGSVMEFDGVVMFDMSIDEAGYRAIAAREGWVLPERVRLHFPPPPNPRSVDPALVPLVRVFARADLATGLVRLTAISARLILRDGCFRLEGPEEPLVLFGRDVELGLDGEGYLAVIDPEDHYGHGTTARVGEHVVWAGPRDADEADAGVKALRDACGPGRIEVVGEPESQHSFDLDLHPGR